MRTNFDEEAEKAERKWIEERKKEKEQARKEKEEAKNNK